MCNMHLNLNALFPMYNFDQYALCLLIHFIKFSRNLLYQIKMFSNVDPRGALADHVGFHLFWLKPDISD